MISLLALFLCSLVVSYILTPICRDVALRAGLVDSPDQKRKLHAHPIPRVGGVPIMAACLFSVLLLVLCGSAAGGMVVRALPSIARLFPAVLVIFAVGLLDDLIALKPRYKLAGQLVAAGLAFSAGVRIHSLGGHAIQSWWALPLTVFWLVGCTNAVNLIDGVDGLAAGVGLVATLTTLVAALLQPNLALALATVPLAGALCGFLRYNFNPASIFLGDSGSLLIGFLLGAYGLIWSQKST